MAFVSDPISPLHLLKGIDDDFKERYQLYRSGGQRKEDLWIYVPGALLTPHNKPILKTNWIYENWDKLTSPNVVTKVSENGFAAVDLLYLDSIAQSFWLDKIKFKQAIFRVADNNSGFKKTAKAAQGLERTIAGKVNTVVYTAGNLKAYVEALQPQNMAQIQNGVNFAHFYYGGKERPMELKDIPRPIALYVGAISDWFDYQLLMQIATALPKVSFVLIGPEKMAKERLQPLANIYLLGRKNYQDIPPFLHNADVGIIPFNKKDHPDLVNSINPLKLYEYMSCGLPVVSTDWVELRCLNSQAMLCNTTEEFIRGISIALDLRNLNHKSQLIDYAKQYDWKNIVCGLIGELDL